jgi:hypothetical protein
MGRTLIRGRRYRCPYGGILGWRPTQNPGPWRCRRGTRYLRQLCCATEGSGRHRDIGLKADLSALRHLARVLTRRQRLPRLLEGYRQPCHWRSTCRRLRWVASSRRSRLATLSWARRDTAPARLAGPARICSTSVVIVRVITGILSWIALTSAFARTALVEHSNVLSARRHRRLLQAARKPLQRRLSDLRARLPGARTRGCRGPRDSGERREGIRDKVRQEGRHAWLAPASPCGTRMASSLAYCGYADPWTRP